MQVSEPGQARGGGLTASEKAELLAAMVGTAGPALDRAELAGMAKGASPEVLSLEQAYTIALIRARAPEASQTLATMNGINSKTLEELAKRTATGDFERFRKDFFSSSFRDPTRRFFAVLKHRAALDSARNQLTLAKNMRLLFETLVTSEGSGVSRLHVEIIDQSVLVSGQSRAADLISYRSAIDELKVALGLSVAAPLVLEERILEPFTTAFAAIEAWQRNPNRRLDELSGLHDRLPRLDDISISARTLAEVVHGSAAEDQFLKTCIDTARSHRAIIKDERTTADAQRSGTTDQAACARVDPDTIELRSRA